MIMKTTIRSLAVLALCLALAPVAAAQTITPSSFNYQGVLKAGDGTALPAGEKTIDFKLYGVATGGSVLWGRSYVVNLDAKGLFNVELDDTAGSHIAGAPDDPLPDVISNHAELFLALTVSGSSEIQPRQRLLSVPYALLAKDVKQASSDFTVSGALTANDGITTSGTVQAKKITISENGQDADLSVNSSGQLEVANLKTTGNIAVDGNVGTTGDISATGGLNFNGSMNITGAKPIEIHQCCFKDMGTGTTYTQRFDKYSIDEWSACVVGFDYKYGDIDEYYAHPLIKAMMVPDSDGTWVLTCRTIALSDTTDGCFDVMFIRRQLVNDFRLPQPVENKK